MKNFLLKSAHHTKKLVYAAVLLLLVMVGTSVNYLFAAWTAPTNNPPRGNIAVPLNTGGGSQTKSGSFTAGSLESNGNINSSGRNYYFAGRQRLYGDNSSAMHWFSNNNYTTQLLMRDKQGTIYGRLYGGQNGSNFGLLDGDGNWSYLAQKDSATQFRINNNIRMIIKANGQVGIGDTSPDNGLKLDVAGKIGANQYCDQNGNNCTTINGTQFSVTGPYKWKTGAWGSCRGVNDFTSCITRDGRSYGAQGRTVECISTSQNIVVHPKFCTATKPDVLRNCSVAIAACAR